MRHSYNTCNFSSGSKFSEYLIWFIDTPFNVDDVFVVVFHRKIPHHQLRDSLWLHCSNTVTEKINTFPRFSSFPIIYIKSNVYNIGNSIKCKQRTGDFSK